MAIKAIPATPETIYAFIRAYIDEHGFSPSLREIGEGCFIAHSTVVYNLSKLELQGRLLRESGKARSIVLLEADEPAKILTNVQTNVRKK